MAASAGYLTIVRKLTIVEELAAKLNFSGI
jgi:hypothetical protein